MSKEHCRTLQVERFFQQCRMLLRQSRTLNWQCRWCGRGLTNLRHNHQGSICPGGGVMSYLHAIHWRELHQWLSAAANVTRQFIHCFSSLTSRILFWALLRSFADFVVTEFISELLRRPHILQDEFWGLTCNTPLKSAASAILKFHRVVLKHN